ncbi:hypothetical protein [Streptosporangium canum]|uniref:hypothetical protein n=1 Tax=Streptosporangium canum TaxID=324952 RepID=UPI0033A5EC5D
MREGVACALSRGAAGDGDGAGAHGTAPPYPRREQRGRAQAGISEAWWALPAGDEEDGGEEQMHRFYLQADCLGGVFMKILGRSAKNWKPLLTAETPKEYGRFNWYGTPANRLHWFEQGYRSQGPGACNTWKAPSSKVA